MGRGLFYLLLFILSVTVFYLLKSVLTPFLIAILLCYLFDPLVESTAEKLGRTNTVFLLLAFLVLCLAVAVLALLPLLQKQVATLIQGLPAATSYFTKVILPKLEAWFYLQPGAIDIGFLQNAAASHTDELNQLAGGLLTLITRSGAGLFTWALNLALIPLVMFYLLRDWPMLLHTIKTAVPRHAEQTVLSLTKDCDAVLGAFIRGQLMVMLCLGVFYALGLSAVGVPFGLAIGLLSGLLSIVPYLGFAIGLITSFLLAYFACDGIGPTAGVLVVFTIGQLLEGFWLTPVLVGDKIGLHPVLVIFAVLAGGQLFGFVGTLLALPVAAVLRVCLAYAYREYLASELYVGS